MNIGRALRLCRTSKGFTQDKLAKKIGMSSATISLIESGERDASIETLRNLAIALEVPLEILIFLASDTGEAAGLSDDLRRLLSTTALSLLSERPSPSLI